MLNIYVMFCVSATIDRNLLFLLWTAVIYCLKFSVYFTMWKCTRKRLKFYMASLTIKMKEVGVPFSVNNSELVWQLYSSFT